MFDKPCFTLRFTSGRFTTDEVINQAVDFITLARISHGLFGCNLNYLFLYTKYDYREKHVAILKGLFIRQFQSCRLLVCSQT
jgi:hypothetical protein